MGKLLAASLVFLFAASVSSFTSADEIRPDRFQPLLLAAPDADDPFGNAEDTDERVMGRGGVDAAAANAAVAARGGAGYVGVHVGTPGTFTIVSDGDMQMLLDTRNGKSWLLSNQAGGLKWREIAKVGEKPSTGDNPFDDSGEGADAPTPPDVQLKKRVLRNQEPRIKRELLTTADLKNVINLRDEQIAWTQDQLEATQEQLKSVKQRNKELVKIVAQTNEKNADLKKVAAEAGQRNEELEKQLKEAKEALNARDKEAQVDVIDESQVE
jgi:hypothetical protein